MKQVCQHDLFASACCVQTPALKAPSQAQALFRLQTANNTPSLQHVLKLSACLPAMSQEVQKQKVLLELCCKLAMHVTPQLFARLGNSDNIIMPA